MNNYRVIKKIIVSTLVMVIINNFSYAEQKNIRFTISTNPFKPFLGIASIEFEISVSEHYSVHIFFEKKFIEIIDHPDYVMKLGTRYYVAPPDGFQSKTFLGLNIAYATSKNHFEGDGISLGSELGYKYLLKNKISIFPTLLAHYLLDTKKILPGFEVTFGKQFEYR